MGDKNVRFKWERERNTVILCYDKVQPTLFTWRENILSSRDNFLPYCISFAGSMSCFHLPSLLWTLESDVHWLRWEAIVIEHWLLLLLLLSLLSVDASSCARSDQHSSWSSFISLFLPKSVRGEGETKQRDETEKHDDRGDRGLR